MQIAQITLPKTACLAPMAGVADRALREISTRYGACYAVGEMASAKGIVLGSEKSKELLTPDQKRPFAVQLFGDEPDVMAKAAVIAEGYHPDIIDINMGCPAPKIVGGGGGSALMKTPKLAGDIVKAVVSATDLPVTVKIRLGWDESSRNAVELAKICEESGAQAITVHGRTRVQMYAPPVNLEGIAQVVEAVSLPIIGNGDIYTPEDALNMYRTTGCDLVMVGRGALGNPWLFTQIKDLMESGSYSPTPPLPQRVKVMEEHLKLLIAYKGETVGYREARKHSAWYIHGFEGAAAIRKLCGEINDWSDIERIIDTCLETAGF